MQWTIKSYLPGWCVALITQGAAIWGSRPLHSGAVILEDSPSGLLHSVIFDRGSLALALLPNTQHPTSFRLPTHMMMHAVSRRAACAVCVALLPSLQLYGNMAGCAMAALHAKKRGAALHILHHRRFADAHLASAEAF